MNSISSEIRHCIELRSDAIRARDIDTLMSFYAAEIVYFDLVPPLRYLGSVSLRQRFLEWFDRFESPIAQTVSSFEVSGDRDHASAFMLIRAGGTLKSGAIVDYWVRATSCLERSAEQWLIRHEHISVPADLIGGRALTDLAP